MPAKTLYFISIDLEAVFLSIAVSLWLRIERKYLLLKENMIKE